MRRLLLLFVIAFVIKAAYLGCSLSVDPTLTVPAIDSRYYIELSRDFRALSLVPEPEGIFLLSPGYALFLTPFSFTEGSAPVILYGVQLLLGCITLLLLYHVTKRLFGATAGWMSVLLYLFYGPATFYEVHILSESIVPLVLLIFFSIIIRKPSIHIAVTAGLVLGFLYLLRPNVLLFLPPLFIWIILKQRKWVLLIAGTLPFLLFIPAVHYAGTGKLFPTSGQAGVALYLGNHPQAYGLFTNTLGLKGSMHDMAEQVVSLTRKKTGEDMTEEEINRFWMMEVVDFAVSNPAGFTNNLLLKSLRLVDNWEYGLNYQWSPDKPAAARIFFIPFALIAAAGIGGILLSRRREELFPLYLFLLTLPLSLILYFPSSRHRFPLVVLLCIFGGFFLTRVPHLVKSSQFLIPLLCGAVLILSFTGIPDERRGEDPYILHSQAISALQLEDSRLAESYIDRALSIKWDISFFHLMKGEILRFEGRTEEARIEDLHAFYLGSGNSALINRIGAFSLTTGKLRTAESVFSRSIERNPESYQGYINLSQVYYLMGRIEPSWNLYQQALSLGMPARPGYASRIIMAFPDKERESENREAE